MNKYIKLNIDSNVVNAFTTKDNNDLPSVLQELSLPKDYYCLNQTHSNTVNFVDESSQSGNTGDGLITRLANKPLVIKAADCVPIVLYDKKERILGAIHSGWKGTLNNIAGDAIDLMISTYNCCKDDIYVYLYPSIKKCHFEIEDDVYRQFESIIDNMGKYTVKRGPKYYVDLQEIIMDNLLKKGINNIYDCNMCTYCNHETFYSYRFDHTKERNYLVVMMKEQK